ncbi:MAG: hypothetical protein ACHP65_05320, partial [Legionellales bacterium]
MHQKSNLRLATTDMQFSRVALAIASLLTTGAASAAANLSIAPTAGLPLPTSLYAGETVYAYYTVTNNTHSTRSGYSLQGLPASVTQNTQNPAYCSNPVTIPSHSSCTLQLNITGPVQSGFILCNGSSCASAALPLNVKQLNTPPPAVAAGAYQSTNPGNNSYPLLATSNGSGLWTYTIDSYTTILPDDYVTGIPYNQTGRLVFNSASCSGQTCLAVGAYSNSSSFSRVQYPLIASSKDGGNTWIYTLDSATATSVPANFNNGGNFKSASCSGQTCVTAGFYSNGSGFSGVQYPLIASSQDGGNTWSYTLDSATATSVPADFNGDGNFNNVSCSGQTCVTAGFYSNGSGFSGVQYPLIASSQDG